MVKGRWLLAILAGWGMVDAMTIVLSGALKGAGDTRFVLLFALFVNWGLWIPGIFLLMRLFGSDALLPQWLYMLSNVLLMGFGFGWRFRSRRWCRIEMIHR